MRTKKQKALLFLKFLAVFIALSIVMLFVFREALLQKAITKIESKLATDYTTKLTIGKAQFDGVSGIELQNINLVPNQADTLVSVAKIKTKINKRARLLKNCNKNPTTTPVIKQKIKDLNKEIKTFFNEAKTKNVRNCIKPGNSKTLWDAVNKAKDCNINSIPETLF